MLIHYLAGQHTVGVLFKDPLQQIIHIVKVIVKRLTVHAADLDQILNGDLVYRFYCKHLFERRAQGFLCC